MLNKSEDAHTNRLDLLGLDNTIPGYEMNMNASV